MKSETRVRATQTAGSPRTGDLFGRLTGEFRNNKERGAQDTNGETSKIEHRNHLLVFVVGVKMAKPLRNENEVEKETNRQKSIEKQILRERDRQRDRETEGDRQREI